MQGIQPGFPRGFLILFVGGNYPCNSYCKLSLSYVWLMKKIKPCFLIHFVPGSYELLLVMRRTKLFSFLKAVENTL